MTHNYNNSKIDNQATHSTLTLKKQHLFTHIKWEKRGVIYFAVLLLSCQRKKIFNIFECMLSILFTYQSLLGSNTTQKMR